MTEHGPHGDPSIADLFFPAINFVLFALLVWRYLAGPIREYVRARTERLREALAAGDNARRDAAALRAQIEKDLAELPVVQERLKADMRDAAARERDVLLAQARAVAGRVREDARVLADQEVEAARRAVRAEVSDEAVRHAIALVRTAIGPHDQERFIRDFLSTARPA